MSDPSNPRQRIAVIGTGISGMAAAWLLSQRHDVCVYERDSRIGGHSNTIMVPGPQGETPIDIGFIVYNEATYPNLTALFRHLGVPTQPSEMSFAASLAGGTVEYSGGNLAGLFAQPRNILRPRFWSMLNDLLRFYRNAARDLVHLGSELMTLGEYLDRGGYGAAFREDHLLPMAGAIWSAPTNAILNYPAAAFIRFHDNHGLLKLTDRPEWRTVSGGSRRYVEALTESYSDRIRTAAAVVNVRREHNAVVVNDVQGGVQSFDHVVFATHADQTLALLDDATADERRLLSPFRYARSTAVLHSDASLMPKRRAVWSSWNYIGPRANDPQVGTTVTYWMNALQGIPGSTQYFTTLNPHDAPRDVWHTQDYEHPLFDSAAIAAQRRLWSLQGRRNTWFCGSYFGAGFHEDGLQSALAVAEALGGVRRPWTVANESGRIFVDKVAERAA